jgi:hypothetical protein
MAGVCDHIKAPATVGTHHLHVTLPPANATVTGDRSVNGALVEVWEQKDLQTPRPFEVRPGERHQVNVRANFTGEATVIAAVKFGTVDQAPPCSLTQGGFTTAAVALIA